MLTENSQPASPRADWPHSRNGFFNVWGIHFDPAQGKPIGEAFAVTKFESPALMIPEHISSVELSLSQSHLVLTLEQASRQPLDAGRC